MIWPNLTTVLSPIRWAVVGAVATRLYMPERITQDLDIAVKAADAQKTRQKLSGVGFAYRGELSIERSSWAALDGKLIDVLEGREAWWADALSEAQTNLDAQGLPILPLCYLVLMKFQSGRVQDIADVARMLGGADEKTLSSVRALFAEYLPEDIEDLGSLIKLGKLEMQ